MPVRAKASSALAPVEIVAERPGTKVRSAGKATHWTTSFGLLGYFADRTVVNLDGLMNDSRFWEMRRSGDTAKYVLDEGIGYLVDEEAYLRELESKLALRREWAEGSYAVFRVVADKPGK
jgi:hypothetical protein